MVNYASITAAIANANRPRIVALKEERPDLGQVISGGLNTYYNLKGKQNAFDEQDRIKGLQNNLSEAIASGDENAINNAYAQLNPSGYMEYLNKIKANREASDLEFQRQKELLDIQNQNAMGLAKMRASLESPQMTSAARNYEYLKSQGLSDSDSMAIAFGGNTEAVGGALASGSLGSKGINAYDAAMGKAKAEREAANQDYQTLLPSALKAIERGENATKSGVGIGPLQGRLGSFGIATQKGSENQADITAANSQMNAVLRQKLAATGLTGSELNSAVEAQAYRYTVDPSMPTAYINKQFENFKNDYLKNNNMNKSSLDMNDPKIRAAKEAGYTDEEIQEFLRGRNG